MGKLSFFQSFFFQKKLYNDFLISKIKKGMTKEKNQFPEHKNGILRKVSTTGKAGKSINDNRIW